MRPSVWKITVCLLAISILNLPAEANNLFQAEIAAGCGNMSGNTAYKVGGRITTAAGSINAHFPVSKLDFSIDAYLLTIHAGITIKNRLTGSLSWGTKLTGDPDKLRDYDWQASPDELSIYSESRLDMDADVFSGKIQYRLFQSDLERFSTFFHPGDKLQLLAGAGFLYQQLDFKAYDTMQTYPGQNTDDDFVSGRTLDYSIEYLIPIMEMGIVFETAIGATAEVCLGYSPYVEATDQDYHLLRNLYSEADCKGEAVILTFNCRYIFFKQWYAVLLFSHLEIFTDGTSRTFINDSWDHNIDTEIESKQSMVTLELGYAF